MKTLVGRVSIPWISVGLWVGLLSLRILLGWDFYEWAGEVSWRKLVRRHPGSFSRSLQYGAAGNQLADLHLVRVDWRRRPGIGNCDALLLDLAGRANRRRHCQRPLAGLLEQPERALSGLWFHRQGVRQFQAAGFLSGMFVPLILLGPGLQHRPLAAEALLCISGR